MKGVINFNAIRLTTELNKFQRHKTIPTSFLDGTFTINDLKKNYEDLSTKHKKLADKLILQYTTDISDNKDELHNSFVNDYEAFLNNQCTRNESWQFPAVMAKFRSNINPVRALIYDTKDAVKFFNHTDDHHMWLNDLITDKEINNRLLECIISDRTHIDKILNQYHPIFSSSGVQLPIEFLHLKQLRQDLLEYANFVTSIKNWKID